MVGKRLPNMAGACPFLYGWPGCPCRRCRQRSWAAWGSATATNLPL